MANCGAVFARDSVVGVVVPVDVHPRRVSQVFGLVLSISLIQPITSPISGTE